MSFRDTAWRCVIHHSPSLLQRNYPPDVSESLPGIPRQSVPGRLPETSPRKWHASLQYTILSVSQCRATYELMTFPYLRKISKEFSCMMLKEPLSLFLNDLSAHRLPLLLHCFLPGLKLLTKCSWSFVKRHCVWRISTEMSSIKKYDLFLH